MTATDTTRPNPDASGSIQTARQNRRRRTIYASLAGWTLLGAASVGPRRLQLVRGVDRHQLGGRHHVRRRRDHVRRHHVRRDVGDDLGRGQQPGDVGSRQRSDNGGRGQ